MGINSIFNRFKLPFLKTSGPGVGIDISDTSCKALALESKSGKIKVTFFANKHLKKGVVSDGKILHKRRLTDTLREIKNEIASSGIKSTNLIATVPESKTFMHVFRLPQPLKEEGLKQAVYEKARTLIPFKPEEVCADFETLASEGNFKEVLYVASPKKIVKDYITVFQQSGLPISTLDIEAASLNRSLVFPQERKNGVLLFDCGARTTTLTIFDASGLRDLNNINMAGQAFTKAIAHKLGISPKKAESLKRKQGLGISEIEQAVGPILNSLYRQTKDTLDRYQRKYNRQIKTIILCGGSSLLKGLQQYMQEKFTLQVKQGQPFRTHNIVVPDRLFQKGLIETSPLYATVLGSALRGVQKKPSPPCLDLLPDK